MSITRPLFFSRFAALNFSQFFAALNDNLYKLLLAFYFIELRGDQYSNIILALAGGIYVLPFILFTSTAGTLADRYSKSLIIYITRFFDIFTAILAIIMFVYKTIVGAYIVLFLMATHSAIFSPSKYGIIPEIVERQKVPRCNGLVTGFLYIAIIIGTFFASFIPEISGHDFILSVSMCLVIAVIAALFSFGIGKTVPQAPEKKIAIRFFHAFLDTLKRAREQRYLFPVIFFESYFLFFAAYTQLNLIPFAIQSLHISEIQGGYLFLMAAIGIGLGSFLSGQISGKEVQLGIAPLVGMGVALSGIGIYVFNTHFYAVIPLLISLGFFGGMYIVPLDSFIQIASPEEDRGQNVAAANFLSFIGVLIASFFIWFFGQALSLTAAQGFLIVSLITMSLAIFMLILFVDQELRFIMGLLTGWFCKIRVIGRQRVKRGVPALLVAPRTSWADTLIIMATLPRLIRYIVPIEGIEKKMAFFYRLLSLIPLDIKHFSPLGPKALEAVKKELEMGQSVCLMHPVQAPTADLKQWEQQLEQLLKDIQVPIMPIHISRTMPEKSGYLAELKSLRQGIIKVSYGNKETYKKPEGYFTHLDTSENTQ